MNLNRDIPKNTPSEDLLGYANFAEFVARNIIMQHLDSGFVLSINAPWGYGKTTCLRFIEHYLTDQPDIEILHFNPWAISDNKGSVILYFLHVLGEKLRDIIYETEQRKEQRIPWNEKIARWLKHKSHKRNKPNEFNAIWKGIVGHFSATYVEQVEKNYNNLHFQKQQIEKLLASQSKRLVVFIDDIDRLTKDEIRDMFRLIKAIADFNFITYVIAFDQQIVVEALDKDFCNNGFDYIEKIIQIPLTLPKIDSENITNLLYVKLDDLIKNVNYTITNENRQRWFIYNKELIEPNIKSIRDINRLFNGLLCNYSQIAADVDLIDFLALEVIRLFRPTLYQEISDNLPFFAGETSFIFKDEKQEYFKTFSINYPNDLNVIKTMFPQIGQFLSGSIYGTDWQERWNREKRICSDERVNIYFGLRLKEGQVSDVEVSTFLASLNSQDVLDNAILDWSKEKLSSGRSKLFFWVPKITSIAPQILDKKLESFFISSIFKFRNSFNDADDVDFSLITINNETRFMWLYNAITKDIKDENYLFQLIKTAVTNSNNLASTAEFMLKYATPHGLFPDFKDPSEMVITKEHYLELESIFIKKIRDNFTKIHTYNSPVRLLQFVHVRANTYYNKAMVYYTKTDVNLINLLESLYISAYDSEKGLHKQIATWALYSYISDAKLINKLEQIQKQHPVLSTRAHKIIEDIKEAVQNSH